MENNTDPVKFIHDYFSDYSSTLSKFLGVEENVQGLARAAARLKKTKADNKKIMLVGNGGSSAIAEHMAIDLTKNAGLRAMTISGTPMITTFSNDYGYDKVFQKGVEVFGEAGDVLIAVSSGGKSPNILNACEAGKQKGLFIITFSGFSGDNPLRRAGDINFWLDSKSYGYVEIIHNLLIHSVNDLVIGSAYY